MTQLHHVPTLALLAWVGVLCGAPAQANDRPFQSACTAVSENEVEGKWAIESWARARHWTFPCSSGCAADHGRANGFILGVWYDL